VVSSQTPNDPNPQWEYAREGLQPNTSYYFKLAAVFAYGLFCSPPAFFALFGLYEPLKSHSRLFLSFWPL
jgi:hypothetical protein